MSAESVPTDRLIGQVLAGRYEILHRLGEGAMGVVYRARHVKVGRPFAVKVLHAHLLQDTKLAQRFEREAELAGRLRHPNVVGVVDIGELDDTHFMVMDFAEGPDLGQLLTEAPMPPARIIHLVRHMLEGLYHAHEQGLIHRDFKPENVIVERDDHGVEVPRIVDFGIALVRELGDSVDTQGRLTTNGLVLGTPHYMAPEQAVADPIDHRIDLFALGIVIYEMLSGRLPFDGSGAEVARANLLLEPPPIRLRVPKLDVDPLLEAFSRRLMAKRRDARPATAKAARELLDLIDRDRRAAGVALGVPPELGMRAPGNTDPRPRSAGGGAPAGAAGGAGDGAPRGIDPVPPPRPALAIGDIHTVPMRPTPQAQAPSTDAPDASTSQIVPASRPWSVPLASSLTASRADAPPLPPPPRHPELTEPAAPPVHRPSSPPPPSDALPVVVLPLTDGLPTIDRAHHAGLSAADFLSIESVPAWPYAHAPATSEPPAGAVELPLPAPLVLDPSGIVDPVESPARPAPAGGMPFLYSATPAPASMPFGYDEVGATALRLGVPRYRRVGWWIGGGALLAAGAAAWLVIRGPSPAPVAAPVATIEPPSAVHDDATSPIERQPRKGDDETPSIIVSPISAGSDAAPATVAIADPRTAAPSTARDAKRRTTTSPPRLAATSPTTEAPVTRPAQITERPGLAEAKPRDGAPPEAPLAPVSDGRAAPAAPPRPCDMAIPSVTAISPSAISTLYYKIPEELAALPADRKQDLWGRFTRYNVQDLMKAPEDTREAMAGQLWRIIKEARCRRAH